MVPAALDSDVCGVGHAVCAAMFRNNNMNTVKLVTQTSVAYVGKASVCDTDP